MARILEECPGCGRKGLRHDSNGLCGKCASRERRKDPERRRKDLEASRKWKEKHPGHDTRERHDKRPPVPEKPTAIPVVTAFCKGCGIQLIEPAPFCGFCIDEQAQVHGTAPRSR